MGRKAGEGGMDAWELRGEKRRVGEYVRNRNWKHKVHISQCMKRVLMSKSREWPSSLQIQAHHLKDGSLPHQETTTKSRRDRIDEWPLTF